MEKEKEENLILNAYMYIYIYMHVSNTQKVLLLLLFFFFCFFLFNFKIMPQKRKPTEQLTKFRLNNLLSTLNISALLCVHAFHIAKEIRLW